MSVQDSYTAKVEELVKIKQKQDEDKAAAKLHSFKFVSLDIYNLFNWYNYCGFDLYISCFGPVPVVRYLKVPLRYQKELKG